MGGCRVETLEGGRGEEGWRRLVECAGKDIDDVPRGDGTIDVAIDDRMYLIDEQTLLNESILTKFGLRVGELTLVIRRLGEADGW